MVQKKDTKAHFAPRLLFVTNITILFRCFRIYIVYNIVFHIYVLFLYVYHNIHLLCCC